MGNAGFLSSAVFCYFDLAELGLPTFTGPGLYCEVRGLGLGFQGLGVLGLGFRGEVQRNSSIERLNKSRFEQHGRRPTCLLLHGLGCRILYPKP